MIKMVALVYLGHVLPVEGEGFCSGGVVWKRRRVMSGHQDYIFPFTGR